MEAKRSSPLGRADEHPDAFEAQLVKIAKAPRAAPK
jgi:hypothetical protein